MILISAPGLNHQCFTLNCFLIYNSLGSALSIVQFFPKNVFLFEICSGLPYLNNGKGNNYTSKMTTVEKIANIENQIKRHEYNFFVLGEETISRPELEILKVELYNLKNMNVEETPAIHIATHIPESGGSDDGFEFYDGV